MVYLLFALISFFLFFWKTFHCKLLKQQMKIEPEHFKQLVLVRLQENFLLMFNSIEFELFLCSW